ncbi:hypothetical protein BB021_07755 [Elizabethkingia ursingii]|uniref:Uncharacterized protein n=1 Tax=Elizabethkingia ursingii TaxID=1756150 RepID=A0ABX3NB17_9FLAO|nr:hypothetical protein BB021_07755 [Elizabethkingia ursingii]
MQRLINLFYPKKVHSLKQEIAISSINFNNVVYQVDNTWEIQQFSIVKQLIIQNLNLKFTLLYIRN